MRWYLTKVLCCISLIISDVQNVFKYLFGHLYVFFEKNCLFGSSAYLKNWVIWDFLQLTCRSSLYILDINPLSYRWFESIFIHSAGCLFILLICSFCCVKAFQFDVVPLIYLCFCWLCFWYQIKKKKKSVAKMFFLLGIVWFLVLIFKFLIFF